MKLLLIRHGSPDYEHDCLTERGREEAVKLAAALMAEKIDAVYSSPMGRARETAGFYCELAGRQFEVLDWLHEFDVMITDPTDGSRLATWDIRPKIWTEHEALFDRKGYKDAPELVGSDMYERGQAVGAGVDKLLAQYGLIKEGGVYRKEGDTDKTLALFCHFGATCVVIAHLLGISPMLALNGFSAEPTAIATLCTDDRFEDKVNFRLHGYGDISHLGEKGSGKVNYK